MVAGAPPRIRTWREVSEGRIELRRLEFAELSDLCEQSNQQLHALRNFRAEARETLGAAVREARFASRTSSTTVPTALRAAVTSMSEAMNQLYGMDDSSGDDDL